MIRIRLVLFCCLWIGIISAHAQVPAPDFSASTVSGCGPLAVNFKDLSTGAPIYWTWDLGNGQISSLQNPSTVYTTPGTYTVTLIVKNKNGANSIRKTDYITVFPYPSASFGSNLTLACAPANVLFNDLSTPGMGTITERTWDFGDGATSSLLNPSHTYSGTGYFTVTLKVKNSGGCSNTASRARYIRVVQGAQPNFTYTQVSNSCTAPYQLDFINQTAGPGNLSYSWNFGNGNTSTQDNPTAISYPSNGNYTVILTATSDLGCSDTAQRIISFSAATPVITAPGNTCINAPVNFGNGSIPIPTSAVWDFGDGTGAADPPPAKTYTTIGAYTVKLVNTYPSCKDSITKTIQIMNNPVVSFTADKMNSCRAPFDVTFKDNTTGATGWQWDFGDGGTSNLQNPPHTYNTLGNFDVTLTVTTATGCTGTLTKAKMIEVQTPTVGLSSTSILGACTSSTTTFNTINPVAAINAVDRVPATGFQWSAPGATPSTSTLVNPSFTYAAPGNYTISLTITTNGGCQASAVTNNVLIGNPTTPIIQVSAAPHCGRDSITFTSTATPADHWAWNFGDGTPIAAGASVKHSYDNFGDFTVKLTLTNAGCPQTTTMPVHVNPPIVGFTFQPDCINKFQVTFIDTSKVDPALGVPTYSWDFGDPSVPPFTGQVPPLAIYPGPGIYNVTLTVTNGICSSTATVPVNLNPPVASFAPPAPACRNRNFTLTSTSTNASLIATYSWQFDANTPDATTPVITTSPTYTASISKIGPHTITLIITDIYHCPSPAATGSITITGPTAKFTPATPGGCKNSPIVFTDQSTTYDNTAANALTTWTWDFGDGTITNLTAPYTYSYADTGFYNVTLAVTDQAGCSDTITGAVPVQITSPQALFAASDTLYCPNAPLPFQDSSKGYNLTYTWDFGDGTPPDLTANPSHSFPTNGQRYSIKLKVTDQTGCSDSLTRSDYIHIQKPIAAFTLEDSTSICPPLETMFTPNGQYYDSLYWDFGDGSTSTLPNTSHFFNTYDTFYVKLFLQGPGGCLDSATRRVFVLNPQTTTTFTYTPVQKCDSLLADFTIIPPGYTRFTLTFGDGTADSSQNTSPIHLYRSPSTYAPQLILQDSTGCIVSLSGSAGNIKVLGAVPFFSMDTHAFCDSGTVYFTDFTITNDGILSKTWDFGDGATATHLNDPSGFDTVHSYTTTGLRVIDFKVTTNNNCAENYADTLKVHQTPHPVITPPNPLCINIPLQFQGGLVTPEDPVDTVNWAWNFGNDQTSAEQNPLVSYSQAGQYTVSLRTFVNFGCSDTISRPITVNPLPFIKGPSEITTPVGFPVTIPFTYSSNVTTYSWVPATNLSCNDCPNPAANPTFNTLYIVTVTDSNLCMSTDSILVKTICNGKNYFIPNTFSPNNDGVNDVFYPRGDNLYNIQSMRVFNRWGQLVFERRNFPANTASEGWDGTFNGHLAPSDTYVYIIEVICNNAQTVALKGDITLLR